MDSEEDLALAGMVEFRCLEIQAPVRVYIPVLKTIFAVERRELVPDTDELRNAVESCVQDVLHLLGQQSLLPVNEFSKNFWTSKGAAPLVKVQSVIYEADTMTVNEAAKLVMPRSTLDSARNELTNKVMRGRLSGYLHPDQQPRGGNQKLVWYVRKSQVMKLLAEREVHNA